MSVPHSIVTKVTDPKYHVHLASGKSRNFKYEHTLLYSDLQRAPKGSRALQSSPEQSGVLHSSPERKQSKQR